MSMYWNLRRLDYNSAVYELKSRLPQLKNEDSDILADKLRGSGLMFYKRNQTKTPLFVRFTLPFAIVTLVLMLITLPINFLFTGEWGYKVNWIKNWFNSLGWH